MQDIVEKLPRVMAPFQRDAYAKIQGSFIFLKKLNEDGIKNVMFCLYEQYSSINHSKHIASL